MTDGLEVVVRPVVLPNIRPSPPRILAPELDASRGIAVLNGSSVRLIDLARSQQSSSTRTVEMETKRNFDVERIYKTDDDGNVDKSTYIDVERMFKLTKKDGKGSESILRFEAPPERDNVEILENNQTRQQKVSS